MTIRSSTVELDWMDELKDVCFFVYANEKLKLKKELVYIIVLQQIEVLCSSTLSMILIYLEWLFTIDVLINLFVLLDFVLS
jgi:hypothetical protein